LPRRTIDVAFPRQKLAVFVDGCYWHGCQIHRTIPKANRPFWASKIASTVQRDAETTAHLASQGWTTLRFWEHEPIDDVVTRIIAVIGAER
jgi:DNA mismatch endonuclease (patch repair protein)